MSKSKLFYLFVFNLLFLMGLALLGPLNYVQDMNHWWLVVLIDLLMLRIGAVLINRTPAAPA